MKSLQKILTTLYCLACVYGHAQQNGPASITGHLVIDKYHKHFDSPQYMLDSVAIANDTMHLFIQYLGGCRTPVFNLISNGGTTKTAPPMMMLYLEQVDLVERCRKICNTRIDIDITGLRATNYTFMFLNIDNKKSITYHRLEK
jgi:hypothetical protein